MKARFIIGLLFIIYTNVSAFAVSVNYDTIDLLCHDLTINVIESTCLCQIDSSSNGIIVSNDDISQSCHCQTNNLVETPCSCQADSSNQNNKLKLYSLIAAVLGVLIGVITNMAITLYNTRKEGIKEFKNDTIKKINDVEVDLKQKVEDYNKLKDNIDKKIELMDNIQNAQNYQNQYLQRINEYLFSITNSVVDSYGKAKKDATVIRENLYNQFYIVKAFLPWSDSSIDSTEAAFRYLQVNGTIENIEDLQFIADNDPDERKRRIAMETIGYIRARLMNEQA